VAVGVCCEELAQHVEACVSPAVALITGLLHDIGQLWLYHLNPALTQACQRDSAARRVGVEVLEREHFGIDHATIGAWLAAHWALPTEVIAAICGHHQPDAMLDTPLVALVHVAEILSSALDLTGRSENHVTTMSSAAYQSLGLVWDDDIRRLFSRIEARANHATAFFAGDAT
jgi:HD-like signal output (HDOD) protein